MQSHEDIQPFLFLVSFWTLYTSLTSVGHVHSIEKYDQIILLRTEENIVNIELKYVSKMMYYSFDESRRISK